MKKSEAITLHTQPANWPKFPVFVWQEGIEYVTDVDGTVFRASNVFGLDSKLDDAGIPSPRNLYFVDAPDYESVKEEGNG
jgi:hypothetical protein